MTISTNDPDLNLQSFNDHGIFTLEELKGATSRSWILKSLASICQKDHLQSVSIFCILHHPGHICIYSGLFGSYLPYKTVISLFLII